jgi:hypothetical protein
VFVEENGPELSSLEIVDAAGVRQLVLLKDPLLLPAPERPARKAS